MFEPNFSKYFFVVFFYYFVLSFFIENRFLSYTIYFIKSEGEQKCIQNLMIFEFQKIVCMFMDIHGE